MVVYERLASLEKIMEEAKNLPLSAKIVVDKEEVMTLIKEIKASLPDELKQAKWISEERQKIIVEAHIEADNIINEAQEKVNKHETVKLAKEKAEKLTETAKKEAEAIRTGSRDYADELLGNIQEQFEKVVDLIKENREELK